MKTIFSKDQANKKMNVTREFSASLEQTWQAWTDKELLDQWWAPKPWKAETKTMNFKEGGYWLYCMAGPGGEQHWSRADYKKIVPLNYFIGVDSFCDEHGNRNPDMPGMEWKVTFSKTNSGTKVLVEITFASEKDLQTIVEMGFEEGFSAAHENLDQYLEAQFKLRNDLKTSPAARTSTYLNFPGNTEEAFNFYKSVFGTEFNGPGIQRFGDLPADRDHPPIPENIKKMVLHVELPILGGHIIMATDAPKEMGMSLTQGNNMHICLEPQTKAETKKLFDALSQGGKIIMPLADMFFGAYFGECTDRFGINWMFNCITKKNA
jgi:PhnB protein